MKNFFIYSSIILFLACAENKASSPGETAKVVIESFYSKDNNTLKKHTTNDGYDGFKMIENMVPEQDNNAKAKILEEVIEGDTAWVKYNSNYDKKPGVFKLLKKDGQWKVTNKGPREKGPF